MGLFANAAPAYFLLGADDKGSVTLPTTRDAVPQHVPLIFMYTRKGTTKKLLASGGAAVLNYGASTFTPGSPYFNHTSRLATEMFGVGNACMLQRLVPSDAGINANIVLYADVLHTTVPNYVRNASGDKVVDPVTNAFQVVTGTPTIAGIKIKYITEVSQSATIGTVPSKTGTMTSGAVTSTMYPILEYRAMNQGEYYNNIGFSIESPVGSAINSAIINADKALTYKLGLVERVNATSVPTVLRSLFGAPSVECTLKPGVKDPSTKMNVDIKSVFDVNWYNETDPLMPTRYQDYEGMHVYDANITLVLAAIMTNEKAHLTTTNMAWFDFTTVDPVALDTETHLINLFTAKSSKGKDYFTVVLDTTAPTLTAGQVEAHISKDTPVFLGGGSDGTLSVANFEAAVNVEMAKYLDPNSAVMDNAVNVETHLYDTGFSLATKPSLLNIIALRKDTVAVLSTHEATLTTAVKPLADTRAIAVSLMTQAKLFPESDFFGTPVARAVIMSGGYKLYSDLGGSYSSAAYELAIKTGRMMGAGNYKWDAVHNFDHGPNAVLLHGHDYMPKFIPAGVKPALWNTGMVWAQPKDRSTYFIPAIQTVYSDDTSPMNSWFTICALVTLNRIASDAWREFTGTATMDDPTFIAAVTDYVNNRINGIFDGLLVVVPQVIIDSKDAQRGYSWQIMFKLYAGNMKTTMVSYTEVYRLTALAA